MLNRTNSYIRPLKLGANIIDVCATGENPPPTVPDTPLVYTAEDAELYVHARRVVAPVTGKAPDVIGPTPELNRYEAPLYKVISLVPLVALNKSCCWAVLELITRNAVSVRGLVE